MAEVDVLDLSVVKLPRLDPINPDSVNTSPCRSVRSPSAMSSSSRTSDHRPIRNSAYSNGVALPPQISNPPVQIVPDYHDNSPNNSPDFLLNPSRNSPNFQSQNSPNLQSRNSPNFHSQNSPNNSMHLPNRYRVSPGPSSPLKRKRSPSLQPSHPQASGLSPEPELRFAQYEADCDDDDVTTNKLWRASRAPSPLLRRGPKRRSTPNVDNKELCLERLAAGNFGVCHPSLIGLLPSFQQKQAAGFFPSMTSADPYSAATAAAQAVAAMTAVPSLLQQTGLHGSNALPALPVKPVVTKRQQRRNGAGQSSRQTNVRSSYRSEVPRSEGSETGSSVGGSCDSRLPTVTAGSDDTEPVERKVYMMKREKNNRAAKKSRDARRIKEEETARRARQLEEENVRLRTELEVFKNKTARLHFLLYSRISRQTPFQA